MKQQHGKSWKKPVVVCILFCIGLVSAFLYAYIDIQNEITRRRLKIPMLAKQIKELQEENARYKYEIDLFESPEHLIELASHHQYADLKQPLVKEIVALPQGLALQVSPPEVQDLTAASHTIIGYVPQ